MKSKLKDSSVEKRRKELPRGDGSWKGYSYVYSKLQDAANYLAQNDHTYLGDDHINIMAAMGSGHEETMKGYMHLAFTYGFI